MALLMLTVTAAWADAGDPILIKWNAAVAAGSLEDTYSCGDFKLTRTDTSDKHSIDANTARFGTAASWDKFDYRFKVGGKSGAGNKLTLAIPEAGVLRVFPRSASGSATDRTLVLTQNETELYNQVVKDADAVDATEDETTVKVYPVVEVPVVAGTVEITYPIGALNFYGFELVNYTVAGSSETLFGTTWAPTNTDNDMVLDGTVYKWQKSGVSLPAGNIEFKVAKNHSWDKSWPDLNYVWNIAAAGKYDVTITFDPYTKTITPTLTATIDKVEIRGSFNGWDTPADGLVMVKQGDTNNYVATLDLTDVNDNVQFKLVLNNKAIWLGWDDVPVTAPSEWTEEAASDNNILLKNGYTGYKTYTMTATWTPGADAAANWTLTIAGKDERPAVYYAAGDSKVWGVSWTVDESNKLTENGAGKYEITKSGLTLSAANYDYKVVKVVGLAQTWIPDPGAANQLVISETAAYDVTLTLDPTEPLSAASYEAVATKKGDFYTVAGAYYDGEGEHASIFGTAWDTDNTANNMVKGEGNLYTKTYAEVDMPAVTLQFKVIKNRNWSESYPTETGVNYKLDIPAAGMYNITITFNTDSKEITATATPVADAYTVAGTTDLTGTDPAWKIDDANNMTLNVTSGLYEWTADDILVSETVKPKFKVWKKTDTWYPAGDDWEITLTAIGASEAAKYDITITFNAATDEILVSGEKSREIITIGEAGWATTVTSSALDFEGSGITAYTATLAGTTVTLNPVENVKAGTAIVLKGAEDTYYVPVIASSSTDEGDLKSSNGSYVVNDTYKKCFGLAVKDASTVRFAKIQNGTTIPVKKAFLEVDPSVSAQELNVTFDDESGDVTGIQTLNAERNTLNGETYNLAGQKVNKSYKGLVISNGRKVIVK